MSKQLLRTHIDILVKTINDPNCDGIVRERFIKQLEELREVLRTYNK